jgi:hypothetical protein
MGREGRRVGGQEGWRAGDGVPASGIGGCYGNGHLYLRRVQWGGGARSIRFKSRKLCRLEVGRWKIF